MQQLSSVTGLASLETKRISALLGLVEAVFCLAAVTPSQLKISDGGGRQELPPPAVGWLHATGLLRPLVHTLISWTKANANQTPSQDAVLCMAGLLNAVATYYSQLKYGVSICVAWTVM